MKKNKWLLIILITLAAITAVLYKFTNKGSTLKKELREFAVKDTSAITKIFLADRNGNSITLDRQSNGNWTLNKTEEPKSDMLRILIDGIYKVEVRNPVSKAAYNNVVKSLASSAVKCEIYLNNEAKPNRTYYVGGQTADDIGTFMMLEGSSMPFITNIPGFNGYLTPRYSVSLDAWKSTSLFRYPVSEIKFLMINYMAAPEKSYLISHDRGRYLVQNPATNEFIQQADTVAIINYLANYSNLYYETEVSNKQRDTINPGEQAIRITVKTNDNKLKTVDIYPVPLSPNSLAQTDSLGKVLKYDSDRVYGIVTPGNKMITIQKPILNRLLREFTDFDTQKKSMKSTSKKN